MYIEYCVHMMIWVRKWISDCRYDYEY